MGKGKGKGKGQGADDGGPGIFLCFCMICCFLLCILPVIIYGAGSVHKGKRYKCTMTATWEVPSQVPETGGTGMGWFAKADNRNYHSGIANVNYYPVLVELFLGSGNDASGSGNDAITCNFVTETDCNKFNNCIYETDTEAREQSDATCADSVSCAPLQCTRPTTNSSECKTKTYCRDKTPEEMKQNAKTTDHDDESVSDDGGVVSGGDFDGYDFNLPTPYSTTMIEFIGSESPGSKLTSSPSVDDSFECYVFNHKVSRIFFHLHLHLFIFISTLYHCSFSNTLFHSFPPN